jgi:hypothetical protein
MEDNMKNPPKQYETIPVEFNTYNGKWSINDEAIHRGANYAEKHAKANLDLARYKEATVFAILKNAYQEGFLHGFEHKFDDHNYERQTDMVSECPTEEKKDGNTP